MRVSEHDVSFTVDSTTAEGIEDEARKVAETYFGTGAAFTLRIWSDAITTRSGNGGVVGRRYEAKVEARRG